MARRIERRDELVELLTAAKTVAVLGAHVDESKPAFYVPDYLYEQGYRVLPVNPGFAGQEAWGEPFREVLTDLEEAVDVVEVFRASRHLAGHLPEILAMEPLPEVVWTQLGVRDPEVTAALIEAGIDVVEDRCMLADHRAFGLGSSG